MAASNPRVTARVHRTDTGDLYTEYLVGGVLYTSADDVEAALSNA